MSRSVASYVLNDWPEFKEEFARRDSAILLGNGSSRAVWSGFDYGSLFLDAKARAGGFTADDLAVFASLKTESFEQVLLALRTTVITMWSLERAAAKRARACYDSIRQQLLEAVSRVHVEWDACDNRGILTAIGLALHDYGNVFSTNYDLLVYWSVMRAMNSPGNSGWFNDFFRYSEFSSDDTVLARSGTRLLFLHGALHLYRDADGMTKKLKYKNGTPILDHLKRLGDRGEVPLFVAEGDGRDKLRSIGSSSYLSFCLERYDLFRGPVTIFGHRIDVPDQHLLKPLTRTDAVIAVALLVDGKAKSDLEKRMDAWCGKLWPARPRFFDSASHPLGNLALKVG